MSRPGKAPITVHTVAVCFHLTPAHFIDRLHALASRYGARLQGTVVSNNVAHSLESPSSDLQVIRGSNAHLDFSGYFEGLQWLLTTRPNTASGNVLFINDSLITNHAAPCIFGRVLQLQRLVAQMAVPAISGKLDPYRSVCLHNPWSGHARYVSSYCFLLNALAQPAMRALPDDAAADGVFEATSLSDAAWGAGMAPVMRESIRAHLLYEDSPYRWQSSNSHDADLTLKKARCVYFESRLSGAIGSNGAVLPINSGPRSSSQIILAETWARVANTLRSFLS